MKNTFVDRRLVLKWLNDVKSIRELFKVSIPFFFEAENILITF